MLSKIKKEVVKMEKVKSYYWCPWCGSNWDLKTGDLNDVKDAEECPNCPECGKELMFLEWGEDPRDFDLHWDYMRNW